MFLIDSVVLDGWPPDYEVAPYAGLVAGVWGSVGGFVAGSICALVTRTIERRGQGPTQAVYGRIAALVTGGLALPVSVTTLMGGGGITPWDATVWVVVPVGASTMVAGFLGAWIWRRTHGRSANLGA